MELLPIKLNFKASNSLVNSDVLNISNAQCFNPLYEKFFILNDNRYQRDYLTRDGS